MTSRGGSTAATGHQRRRRDEHGAVAVEATQVLPAVLLFLVLLLAGGRIWYVHTGIVEVAHATARAGSLTADPVSARLGAERVAGEQLAALGVGCGHPEVLVDLSAARAPVGQAGTVSATIRCRVRLDDLFLPGLPGSLSLTSTGHAIVEAHRGRT